MRFRVHFWKECGQNGTHAGLNSAAFADAPKRERNQAVGLVDIAFDLVGSGPGLPRQRSGLESSIPANSRTRNHGPNVVLQINRGDRI